MGLLGLSRRVRVAQHLRCCTTGRFLVKGGWLLPRRLHPGHADADCQYALWEKRRSGGVAGAGSMYLASRPRPEERVAASGYHCIRQLALLPSGHNAICLRPSR